MFKKFKVTALSLFYISISTILLAATPLQAQAEEPVLSENWQFDIHAYIWAADFSGEMDMAGGVPFDIPFSTLVDNLKMGFYGSFEARKQKWLIYTDIVYLNIETDSAPAAPSNPVLSFSTRDVSMDGGAFNLIGGYNLLTEGRSRLDFVAGVRYLDLGADFGLNVTFFGENSVKNILIDMGTATDVIVGVKGAYEFSPRWSIPYHADIGAGDSDLTWQLMSGISYRAADWVDVALTYRHMEWDLKSNDGLINDVSFSGPSIGGTFHF